MTDASSKPKILLVDDDKFLLDMYVMKFQQGGFEVHGCLSTADALRVLSGGFVPEAILFDLIMPEGDGFALLEALKKDGLAKSSIKIALTNEMVEEERRRIVELGADRYIVKATMIPSEVVKTIADEIKKRNE